MPLDFDILEAGMKTLVVLAGGGLLQTVGRRRER